VDILILEDNVERISSFMAVLHDHHVEYCMSSKSCVKLLYERKWDWLFLDHDLGEEHLVGTGYDVAVWLEAHPEFMPAKGVILHSSNAVGRARMAQALPDSATQLPDAWTMSDLEDRLKSRED